MVIQAVGPGEDGGECGRVLNPLQVAQMMHVDPKTVTRWARSGKLSSFRTPGGHRRYFESEVLALVNESYVPRDV
jgi:excisionase family DNA binding protein